MIKEPNDQKTAMPTKTSDAQTIVSLRSRNAELSRYLKELTETVGNALKLLDEALQQPYSVNRDGRIEGILQGIQMQNDAAKYYGFELGKK